MTTDITVKRINTPGWGRSKTASQCHYFRESETISLCGRLVLFEGIHGAEGRDECVICRNKLNAIRNEIIAVMASSEGKREILADITELAQRNELLIANGINPFANCKTVNGSDLAKHFEWQESVRFCPPPSAVNGG